MDAPKLASWLPAESGFPLENIPFGAVATPTGTHCATRIGDSVVDLGALEAAGLFEGHLPSAGIFSQATLNSFM